VRADFERDGWVVAHGVVGADELSAMREVFATIIPEIVYPSGPDGVLWEITGASPAFEPLARIARDRRFGALVGEALGARRVQLLQDSLLYKPAHDGGTVEWHQDHRYVGYLTPPRVVALRIALHAEDRDNGCMQVVDGSHTWGPVGGINALTESRIDSLLPALSSAQREALAGARPLELAPGDVSIHHCLTLHGSPPNRSDRPRRTIILRMFDGDCRLDAARLPPGAEKHFPLDRDGSLAASAFPLVHG
jgi:ectoine hydroxylase-related dioxygenase (phytanoyl-CoA dioxygenase family)